MTALLLAPSDVLVFPDGPHLHAGPAGGSRLPFPQTVQEALRQAQLRFRGSDGPAEPLDEPGERNGVPAGARNPHLRGPLPWHPVHRHLFPIPLDASGAANGIRRHRPLLLPPGECSHAPEAFNPPCLPAADLSPSRDTVLTGWWTAAQLGHYLAGSGPFDPSPVPAGDLWVEEAISALGGPAAATCIRLKQGVRLAIQAGLVKPAPEERAEFEALLRHGSMLLGGGQRLVHFERKNAVWPEFERPAPPSGPGPFLVRWALLTPALFTHGSLPGWCRSGPDEEPLPDGQVRLRERKTSPFLRAHLIAHHLGRPAPVAGWDGGEDGPQPTQLAVPAGSVYHFLCADAASTGRLVSLLHDRPRSDCFAEAGWGHGLCAQPEPASPELRALASRLLS